MFMQRLLFEELLLERACALLAFCPAEGFYYWKPAVEFPPEFACPNRFACKVPLKPAELERELELRLLSSTFGSN